MIYQTFNSSQNKPAINNPKLIIHYSSDPKAVNSLLFLFMWMMSFWQEMIYKTLKTPSRF